MPYNETVSLVPTLAVDTSAYADGDVVGGLLEMEVSRAAGGGCTVRSVLLVDDDSEAAALTLYLFREEPSTIADNAAFAPSAADLQKLAGVIEIASGDYATLNGNDYALKNDLAVSISLPRGKVWAYLVAGGAVTYTAADDLYLRLEAWRD